MTARIDLNRGVRHQKFLRVLDVSAVLRASAVRRPRVSKLDRDRFE